MSKKEQKSFNEELDKLFEQWIAKSEEENEPREKGTGRVIFTRDGLLEKNDPSIDVYQDWINASRRILFLLKDQPTEWCDDARLWLKDLDTDTQENRDKKKRNRELGTGFLKNIANIFYGLSNATTENNCDFNQLLHDDVALCFNTRPFGILETKKQGGDHSIEDNVLREYVVKYSAFLKEEIKILNANIYVCASPVIFDFFTKEGRDSGEYIFEEAHSGMCYNPKEKILYLTSYHPSARNAYADFYERLMNDFRYFLRSEYAKEFLGQKEA